MVLGSEIRKKPIPDPGSRGQKGTGFRIPDPDPQHCMPAFRLSTLALQPTRTVPACLATCLVVCYSRASLPPLQPTGTVPA